MIKLLKLNNWYIYKNQSFTFNYVKYKKIEIRSVTFSHEGFRNEKAKLLIN